MPVKERWGAWVDVDSDLVQKEWIQPEDLIGRQLIIATGEFLKSSIGKWLGDLYTQVKIDTFMEAYDFSGKTIVPFCTSGGSGIGSSARNLHDLAASDVIWLDGERLSSDISYEEMVSWIDGLSLDVQ